jgi:hypothetical protein
MKKIKTIVQPNSLMADYLSLRAKTALIRDHSYITQALFIPHSPRKKIWIPKNSSSSSDVPWGPWGTKSSLFYVEIEHFCAQKIQFECKILWFLVYNWKIFQNLLHPMAFSKCNSFNLHFWILLLFFLQHQQNHENNYSSKPQGSPRNKFSFPKARRNKKKNIPHIPSFSEEWNPVRNCKLRGFEV